MTKPILPSGWRSVKLRELSDKCTAKNRDFVHSLVLTNSAQHGIVPQTEHFDKEIAVEDNIDSYFIVNSGDFVYNPRISVTAPCGPIRRNNLGKTGVMSPLYIVFKLKENKVDDIFMEYYFSSSTWHRYMKSVANYGARHDRMAITDNAFFAMPLPLPPFSEQRNIAAILTMQDRLILLKEQLISAKRKQKQWLMQNLLTGEIRLPGFSGTWKNVQLRELGKFSKGKGISNNEKGTGNIPCLSYGEIYTTHNEYIKGFQSFISCDVAAEATRLDKGDLLFTCSGETKSEIGKCVAFVGDEEAYAGGDIIILSPNTRVHSLFAGFALNSIPIIKQRTMYGQGDSIVHISKEWIGKFTLLLPTLPEQRAIANVLATADHEIELLTRELAQHRQVKKHLMQQLLTGRIRTKGANV